MHSFATDPLNQTRKLKLVMDGLGHESVTTTQKHLHPALKNIAEVVNQRNKEGKQRQQHERQCHISRHSRVLTLTESLVGC